MNRWKCDRCQSSAVGIGSPLGLRALGWYVEVPPAATLTLRCPAHVPAGAGIASTSAAQGWQWLIEHLGR